MPKLSNVGLLTHAPFDQSHWYERQLSGNLDGGTDCLQLADSVNSRLRL